MNKENNKSFFDWGKGVTVAIVLFICTTLGVVAYVISLDYHMVTENHYEKAEHYQDHINRVEQAGAMQEPVTIEYLREDAVVSVRFPSSISKDEVEGTIELYRPNDPKLDRSLSLKLDHNALQRISTRELSKGKWMIKIKWSSESKEYYTEKSIFI